MVKNSGKIKAAIALFHDTVVAIISYCLAFWLRLGDNFSFSDENWHYGVVIFTSICLGLFLLLRTYRRSWRYASLSDLVILTKTVTLAILIFLPAMFLFNRLELFPRSVIVITWLVMLAFLGGSRLLYRMFREHKLAINLCVPINQRINVLLIGINEHSEAFLRSVASNPNTDYRIVGIIDNAPDKRGQYIRNVKVYGDIASAKAVIEKLTIRNKIPQKLIIAPDELSGEDVSFLLNIAEELGLTLERLPRLTDFSQSSYIPIRPIMLEDLLGRPQKTLHRATLPQFFTHKTVLITGAGGSIGSELVRQVAQHSPACLILLDNSEYSLYSIDYELATRFPELVRHSIISDIRDRKHLDHIMQKHQPDIVYHAAALKHVPLTEENSVAAVETNITGTKNVADACLAAGVQEMVMISTDKAVNPTNVMGATKRLAETYVQALGKSRKAHGHTRFATIRFGNVLGSAGSVIPLFRKQLTDGGPITVTTPDISRYFMTIREAVELVLHASVLAHDLPEHDSPVYVLDMGEPVLIRELAEQLIRLSGLTPYKDIDITYTGLRPGEKLTEELFYNFEEPEKTPCSGILRATPKEVSLADVNRYIKRISLAASHYDCQSTTTALKDAVPEYNPQPCPKTHPCPKSTEDNSDSVEDIMDDDERPQ